MIWLSEHRVYLFKKAVFVCLSLCFQACHYTIHFAKDTDSWRTKACKKGPSGQGYGFSSDHAWM